MVAFLKIVVGLGTRADPAMGSFLTSARLCRAGWMQS